MKKPLLVVIAVMFFLRAWMGAEKHAATLDIALMTSFDFSTYPACTLDRTTACIQAIRFYDADSNALLAEVPVRDSIGRPQRISGTVKVNSIPRHAYAATTYQDGKGMFKEGPPGPVSTFDVENH